MAEDSKGRQAAHLAAMHNHVKILQLLFDHGVDLDCRCQAGKTPLHYAAQHGGAVNIFECYAYASMLSRLMGVYLLHLLTAVIISGFFLFEPCSVPHLADFLMVLMVVLLSSHLLVVKCYI